MLLPQPHIWYSVSNQWAGRNSSPKRQSPSSIRRIHLPHFVARYSPWSDCRLTKLLCDAPDPVSIPTKWPEWDSFIGRKYSSWNESQNCFSANFLWMFCFKILEQVVYFRAKGLILTWNQKLQRFTAAYDKFVSLCLMPCYKNSWKAEPLLRTKDDFRFSRTVVKTVFSGKIF